jgi:hypothetical protein
MDHRPAVGLKNALQGVSCAIPIRLGWQTTLLPNLFLKFGEYLPAGFPVRSLGHQILGVPDEHEYTGSGNEHGGDIGPGSETEIDAPLPRDSRRVDLEK